MQAVRKGGWIWARMRPAGRDQRSAINAEKWVLTNGRGCAKILKLLRKRWPTEYRSEANLERVFESLKKLEKRTWQRAEDVVDWISCAERRLRVVSGRKSLKRHEKSSWQTVSGVIQSKGCCESGADRDWGLCWVVFEKLKNFEKSTWQTLEVVIE